MLTRLRCHRRDFVRQSPGKPGRGDDAQQESTQDADKRFEKCRVMPEKAIHLVKTTAVPFETSAARRIASQLVRRTQPCDCEWPMVRGSGVPWMP